MCDSVRLYSVNVKTWEFVCVAIRKPRNMESTTTLNLPPKWQDVSCRIIFNTGNTYRGFPLESGSESVEMMS